MEEIILGQARGLLILANAAKARGDVKVYLIYLKRINNVLKLVESLRSDYSIAA